MTKWKCPTDLTAAQWQILEPLIRKTSKRGRKVIYSRREVINAILYLNRTGCQWRMLPDRFPPWKTVSQIFSRWRLSGLWQRIHDRLRERVRRKAGRKPQPTAAIIDSRTVKTTHVGGQERGYDGGKKTSGSKRHLVVDTLGLILAVVVHGANQQDQDGACLVLYVLWERNKKVKTVFADSAYGRKGLPEFVRATLGLALELVRRDGPGLQVLRKRWIVERTFAWLGFCRRHSKDYERNPATSEAMIQVSMIHLMLKRLAPTTS